MTDNKLAHPLQNLLAQAQQLPKTGKVSKAQKRIDAAGDQVFILCDVSGSMDEAATSSRRKIEVLQDALNEVRPQFPDARVIAFNSNVRESFDVLPEPEGGTALHYALEYAQPLKPRQTIVVSDGQPDDETLALSAASKLTGTIDVIYCGPDSDKAAIRFMERLARANGGRVVRTNWTRSSGLALAPTMRRLLLIDGRGKCS
jgi:hypothetical protein